MNIYLSSAQQETVPELKYQNEETGEEQTIPALTFAQATIAGGDVMRYLRAKARSEITDYFEGQLGAEVFDKPVSEWPLLAQAQYSTRLSRDYVCVPAILTACTSTLDEKEVANWPLWILSQYYLMVLKLNPSWDLRPEVVEAAAQEETQQVEVISSETGKPLTEKQAKKKGLMHPAQVRAWGEKYLGPEPVTLPNGKPMLPPVMWPKTGRYIRPESIQIFMRWRTLGIPPYSTGFMEWPEWLVLDLLAIMGVLDKLEQIRLIAKVNRS